MNAKNSHGIKKIYHVLQSDSTSSDEYMYEDVIEGGTPLDDSPSPAKLEYKVHIRQPSQSDEEIGNDEDVYEGEEGEEEMEGEIDYGDYEENDERAEEEAISNAGEEVEEESTKVNT